MAFDGITIAAMVRELHRNLDGGRFIRLHSRNRTRLLSRQKGRTASSDCCFLPAHPFR